jgi:nitrate reductase NapAB chaperone NapD
MERLCISSLVVRANPADMPRVRASIEAIGDAQVMGESDEGKFVIVLDTQSRRIAADRITAIQNTDGVLSASLIYQFDDHESRVEESS